MKKKLLRHLALILLALTLILLVTACTVPSGSEPEETTTEPVVTTPAPKEYGNPSTFGAESKIRDNLPSISINTVSGGPITERDVYIDATVSAEGTTDDEKFGFENLTAEVRCRGNYTYTDTEKKSYRLKFTEKINLFNQGYGPAKSWVLLANHCDQSFLRNHVAFAVGRTLSNIEYTTSSSFVKLYVNGEYYGIYQLAEQHQVNDYRVNIFEDPGVVDTDYLIERDSYADDSGEEGIQYFRVNRTKYNVHSDYMTEEKCEFLRQYFTDAHEIIKGGVKEEIEEYIDLASFIDTFILQAFVKNTDVGYSSFYMVKKAGGKIYFTCPWDFDNSQGNDERLDGGSYEGLYVGEKTDMNQQHEWFYLMMNEEWFCNMLRDRWNEVKEDIYNAVFPEIERILKCFGDDMETNFTVWKIFGRKINQEPRAIRGLRTYKAHVEYLETWLQGRYEYLDGIFTSDEIYNYGGFESTGGGWWPWW